MINDDTIREALAAHREQNERLLELLTENGVPADEIRTVEHFFYHPDQRSAALLAAELTRSGMLVVQLSPMVPADEDGEAADAEIDADEPAPVWCVQAERDETATHAASAETTERLLRLAAQYGAEYDGWGTTVE